MFSKLKRNLRRVLPPRMYNLLRALREWKDPLACIAFLWNPTLRVSFQERVRLLIQLYIISINVESPHTQEEILNYIEAILSISPSSKGVLVEAGCYKGSSTAKFSLAADIVGKELVVFDSFQGIPDNTEPHELNIFGGDAVFKQGDYCGSLDEVKATVARFGKVKCCRFIKGWFDDTMPGFKEPISAAYVDVDLASSTRTCLRYLFPLLEPNGVLYSQDGHLPLVIDVFNDEDFWLNEVGCKKPRMHGLGQKKLVKVVKEFQQARAFEKAL
jgi:O-methyltransferase